MSSAFRATPEVEARVAKFLVEANSLFYSAITGKETSESYRHALPNRFQSLLQRYMNDENRNAIGMFLRFRIWQITGVS